MSQRVVSGVIVAPIAEHGCARRGLARRVRPGFTIIEVMIVIAIILALSGLVGFALLGRRDDAKLKLAEVDMNNIKSAIKVFRLDFDRVPSEEEGLAVLWSKAAIQSEEDQAKWKGYLESPLPNDRWGTPWGYRAESQTREGGYDLWSYGRTRKTARRMTSTRSRLKTRPRAKTVVQTACLPLPRPLAGDGR
jgi:general secretion pathway protein G